MPQEERVTTLIQDCHSRCAHGARWATLNEFHSGGYWTNGNSAVQSVIFKCILCSRLRGRVAVQKLAELPAHIPSDFPPFTYCRVNVWVLLDQAVQKWSQMLWYSVHVHGKQGSAYRNHLQFGHRILYSSPKESHWQDWKCQNSFFR